VAGPSETADRHGAAVAAKGAEDAAGRRRRAGRETRRHATATDGRTPGEPIPSNEERDRRATVTTSAHRATYDALRADFEKTRRLDVDRALSLVGALDRDAGGHKEAISAVSKARLCVRTCEFEVTLDRIDQAIRVIERR
jgi:hypothetical protein